MLLIEPARREYEGQAAIVDYKLYLTKGEERSDL
jgi:hypothetical protein